MATSQHAAPRTPRTGHPGPRARGAGFVALLSLLGATLAGCGEPASQEAPPPAQGRPPPVDMPPTSREGDLIAEIDAFIAAQRIDKGQEGWRMRLPRPPIFGFPKDKRPYWILETNKGRITAEFFPQVAPHHVSSFAYLTRLGFFDGLLFHRVIRGFMAQGGDPRGNGTGGPGYTLPLEVHAGVRHDRPGILSAAREPRPHTAGSQFFFTFGAKPQLDPQPGSAGYTIFGAVVDGMGAVRKLEAVGAAPSDRPDAPQAPLERLVIERATIEVR